MTQEEALQIISFVVSTWPTAKDVEPMTIRMWANMITDLDFEDAQRALERLGKTSKFRPMPADIIREATDLKLGPKTSGMEVWEQINEAVRRFGRYRDPVFKDPVTAEVVRQLGWKNICNTPESQDMTLRAHVIKHVEARSEALRKEEHAGSHALPEKKVHELAVGLAKKLDSESAEDDDADIEI